MFVDCLEYQSPIHLEHKRVLLVWLFCYTLHKGPHSALIGNNDNLTWKSEKKWTEKWKLLVSFTFLFTLHKGPLNPIENIAWKSEWKKGKGLI